ncbi:ABC transporter ATP-binding protein [Dactylosporangium siamense]|uniref:Aliphatic sulfonates import ATP-binding protein SsuB n=1 Tax=Dactylosporangium siamense TaxID=685454 RepID=A0A919U7S1_9ACTN|nr:ABC transporter ATP-binding protein [Dactylosporangium siamense]GIG41995.1 aliphatic sulfonates import ATP-binding protein SsuB [Dactylosporangium siamense]
MAARTASQVSVARGVRRSFGDTVVLDGVDLTIGAGEVVALLGGSGSGKSTLLRILAGLDGEATGSVTTTGSTAVVFQEHRLLPWKRVAANVALGVRGGSLRERVDAALTEVGLADRRDAWPAELSGGQAQRVAFARALVREPDLLLLDEPFGALDALTRLRMQVLFGRLRATHGFAALFVTHDVDEALLLADRVLVLDGGRIAEDRPVTLPQPRAVDAPGFGAERRVLLGLLNVPASPS